ncbi:MAG: FHA domain-containing protein [Myxococcota bacterium]
MSRGAPTGKWETLPEHLKQELAADLRKASPKLFVRRPGVPEVEIAIEKTEFVIGRLASAVDLVLEDDLVSRRHASLTMDERGYFRLEDLGSENGIRYQGRPVRRLNLVDGDSFSIGKTEFTFKATMNRFQAKEPSSAAPREASRIEVPDPAEMIEAPPEPGKR